MNLEVFTKALRNQSSKYEKSLRTIFHYERKPSCENTESTLFTVSEDEWSSKEGACKSMKYALYLLQYAKRHLSN